MDRKAKKLGYKGMQHMLEKQAEERAKRREQRPSQPKEQSQKPAAAAASAAPAPESRAARREQLDKERLIEDRRRANKARAAEEKRRVAAEQLLQAREAEHELKFAAVRAGIRDPDYAVVLCQRHAQSLSTEQQQEAIKSKDTAPQEPAQGEPSDQQDLYAMRENTRCRVVPHRCSPAFRSCIGVPRL